MTIHTDSQKVVRIKISRRNVLKLSIPFSASILAVEGFVTRDSLIQSARKLWMRYVIATHPKLQRLINPSRVVCLAPFKIVLSHITTFFHVITVGDSQVTGFYQDNMAPQPMVGFYQQELHRWLAGQAFGISCDLVNKGQNGSLPLAVVQQLKVMTFVDPSVLFMSTGGNLFMGWLMENKSFFQYLLAHSDDIDAIEYAIDNIENTAHVLQEQYTIVLENILQRKSQGGNITYVTIFSLPPIWVTKRVFFTAVMDPADSIMVAGDPAAELFAHFIVACGNNAIVGCINTFLSKFTEMEIGLCYVDLTLLVKSLVGIHMPPDVQKQVANELVTHTFWNDTCIT